MARRNEATSQTGLTSNDAGGPDPTFRQLDALGGKASTTTRVMGIDRVTWQVIRRGEPESLATATTSVLAGFNFCQVAAQAVAPEVARRPAAASPPMIFYGVVSAVTGDAVELFVRREDAEAMVEAWRRDEPEDADALRVEVIELEA